MKFERSPVDDRIARPSDDGLGAESLHGDARAAHLQHLRGRIQCRTYHLAEVPVDSPIAWFGAAVGTAAGARRYAKGKKLGDRISAHPTDHPMQCT
jgi:hypothetical protein